MQELKIIYCHFVETIALTPDLCVMFRPAKPSVMPVPAPLLPEVMPEPVPKPVPVAVPVAVPVRPVPLEPVMPEPLWLPE